MISYVFGTVADCYVTNRSVKNVYFWCYYCVFGIVADCYVTNRSVTMYISGITPAG